MFGQPAGFFEMSGGSIRFPNECFVCSEREKRRFSIRRLQPTSFFIAFYSYRTMRIKVPVCSKHFWQLTLLRLFLWTLIIAGPFMLAASADTFGHTTEIFLGMLIAYFLAAAIYLSMRNNFGIYQIGQWSVTFSVKREEYLLKLLELNDVDPTVPTA